ncbi:hypothetical protein CTRI78_v001772 [Colletotrichum trifolii]|uniref:Large ribosomal subunit protein mL67 n=1 Tax=Colletotrichum trifolii TaxID=5466 RepID=A0A4R8RYR2_COLTR|nr:hypothetical protein CTRI78_v001772 [Colletotrichum trifolii]
MNSLALNRFQKLSVGLSKICTRHVSEAILAKAKQYQMPRRQWPKFEEAKFEKDHGEEIWVYCHELSGQVVYSYTPVKDFTHNERAAQRALAQIPFNGKKAKPATLRPDYWHALARIEVPRGAGAAGQSVFQKLREFKRMHELCWGDEIVFRDTATEVHPEGNPNGPNRKMVRNRQERARALNDQRANAIADLAAVLAGAGRGNRLIVSWHERLMLQQGCRLLGRKWSAYPPKTEATPESRQLLAEGEWWDPTPADRRVNGAAQAAKAEGAFENKAEEQDTTPVPVKTLNASGEVEIVQYPRCETRSYTYTDQAGTLQTINIPIRGKHRRVKVPDLGGENKIAIVPTNWFNPRDELLPVRVFWAVDTDRLHAEKWSGNVSHDLLEKHVKLAEEYDGGVESFLGKRPQKRRRSIAKQKETYKPSYAIKE